MSQRPREKWYRFMGLIVASRLPEGLIVPNVVIRRDKNAGRMKRPTNLSSRLGREGGGFLGGTPSEVTVESDALIELRVKSSSNSDADAFRLAYERYLDPLTASIMIVTGAPAYVELTKMTTENPDRTVTDRGSSVWSDWATMHNFGAMPLMETVERQRVDVAMRLFRQDKVAGSAASDHVAAGKLRWTSGGRAAEQEAIVLREFLVIERIATRVASDRTPEPLEEKARQSVIDGLAHGLRTDSAVQGARRIKNAAAALDKQQGRRLALDIEYACVRLSLTDDVRDAARGLTRLRNQRLAHPGRPQERGQLAESAMKAETAAAAFLAAYVAWRGGEVPGTR